MRPIEEDPPKYGLFFYIMLSANHNMVDPAFETLLYIANHNMLAYGLFVHRDASRCACGRLHAYRITPHAENTTPADVCQRSFAAHIFLPSLAGKQPAGSQAPVGTHTQACTSYMKLLQ